MHVRNGTLINQPTRWEWRHNTFTPSLHLVPFANYAVCCVHSRVVKGSGVDSGGCLVHVDTHESELCCGWLQLNSRHGCLVYHFSSNRRCPQIVATQSKTLEQNKHGPQMVAAASKRWTRTRVPMISDDSHHASARTACVAWVLRTNDSRTESLCVLLTVSGNHHHHVPYPDVSRLPRK